MNARAPVAQARSGGGPAIEDSDEALMQGFARGDARAFDALYARHRGWLYGLLLRQLGDRTRTDDVFQETWLTLVRTAADYQPRARFSTWLYLLARQRLVDHWRRATPEPDPLDTADGEDGSLLDESILEAISDETADPAAQAERRQLGERLLAALALLPVEQREAFLLAEHAGMTVEEIALSTAAGREAVKSRLRYARRKLAALLAAEWNAR